MILPLEQMVTSKDLSERLRTLGVPQDSLFWWGIYTPRNQFQGTCNICTDFNTHDSVNYSKLYSAYLESEIGVLLPGIIWDKKGKQRMLVMLKKDEKYYVGYECSTYDRCREKNHIMVSFEENTRIEAMGLILEYLLVNGLIKL